MSADTNGLSQIPLNQSPAPAPGGEAERAGEAAPASGERVLFTPPIDIYETGEGLVLIADLPGVSVRTLDLQVQNNKLTLLGQVANVVPPGARLLHKEYEEGDFLRSFILSENVDHERVTARLNNGILEVVLPHAEKSVPRRIQVNTD
jgi:HSP20 family molecular chaperone IbpA